MGSEAIHGKLKWAIHHLNVLDNAVAEYIDLKNLSFAPNRHDDAKKLTWGHLESTLPSESLEVISHMFGDVLQSANSCLDFLVAELFVRNNPGEKAKPCHQFPLATSHGAFNKEIGSNALYGIPFEAVAVIEGLQPYAGRTDAVHANLPALRTLTNTHKHRQIHVSVLTASPTPCDVIPIEKDGIFSVRVGDLSKAVHFKTELGPFPITDNGQVDLDRKYIPVVVLEEDGFRGKPITVLAYTLLEAVNESYNRLLPFMS